MRSPAGWGDFPCVECGTEVNGLSPGDRCPACARRHRRAADQVGRKVALGATLLYGAWVLIARPSSPTWLVAMGAPVTYMGLRILVGRLVMEYRR